MPRGPKPMRAPSDSREAVAGPIRAEIARLEAKLRTELHLAAAEYRRPLEAQLVQQRRQLEYVENLRG